ncbi:NAD(P)/FAD-dependent oxidoreductase [Sphingobacterium sp. lm-10]|uniref:phytoene desaturase family protein n=1 Tax=Sphingobacterium sp. lm-10 TaxID=2944904 RepID=UPI0020204789|nr:NAD(P)/FAD-dependent oxidoreductase [Sphingobacterium sp. lm-10]MCL7987637.1 NAD(P)/FAD-dependent oxidoreductase [Sphingobacterium sp. lm-10]
MSRYDAIIVGSGPNGLAAAITLQQQGLSTLLIEGDEQIGGGMRTKELTLPGFKHDVCSAIHPMAMASPFFNSLPLAAHGLEFVLPRYAAAHPLDNGATAFLHNNLSDTVDGLGVDGQRYKRLIEPLMTNWESLSKDIMGPLRFPDKPLNLAAFGLHALQPASWIARRFQTQQGAALWAGMAAHGIQPLSNWTTSAIALVLSAVGNKYGWPVPIGGSQAIANALLSYYQSLGGELQTGNWIDDIATLPSHKVLILDMTPKQLLQLKGCTFSKSYTRQLQQFRQGMGVFKIDWALSEKTPFRDLRCQEAATVHLGNTYAEIAENERASHLGKKVKKPFVLFTQQSAFDDQRAPAGKHTGWAYCHVPNGSPEDYTQEIEKQIERFAPGFRDTILARHTYSPAQLEAYNPNYIGGDINGGIMDIFQLYTRPVRSLTPYRTSLKQVYICSSSTPPGGGVHGMSGYHAAKTALKDHWGIVDAVGL